MTINDLISYHSIVFIQMVQQLVAGQYLPGALQSRQQAKFYCRKIWWLAVEVGLIGLTFLRRPARGGIG